MKKWMLFVLLGYATMLSACAGGSNNSSAALAPIGVEYHWSPDSQCAYVSPAIKLSGVPVGTAQLQFQLDDLDRPLNNHGGGTITYTGASDIARGAIAGIRGPCPPAGKPHRYRLGVLAMDAEKNKLAFGTGIANCCD